MNFHFPLLIDSVHNLFFNKKSCIMKERAQLFRNNNSNKRKTSFNDKENTQQNEKKTVIYTI